ncbi:hypothetical protein SAMN04488581_2336 [Mycolicibacterium neoaurum]|nr:hypothetical protein SAMN04488581_2336 [Mycolicibacterium neoaurum]
MSVDYQPITVIFKNPKELRSTFEFAVITPINCIVTIWMMVYQCYPFLTLGLVYAVLYHAQRFFSETSSLRHFFCRVFGGGIDYKHVNVA